MPMENPFTAYGKGRVFPTGLQTGFPQQRRTRQFTHIPTTPAAANIHPILPIRHKKTDKREQKKSGSTAIGRTEKLYSRFVFMESV